MDKKCCKCKQVKSLDDFSNSKRRKDGKNSMCKQCMREYDKRRFAKMGKEEREKRNKSRRKRALKTHELIFEYLSDKKCTDCGTANTVVLEFDHRGNKEHNIADMARGGYKWDRILKEIEKCDIRCANCHRIKTAKDRGYHRLLLETKREVAQW